MFRFSIRDVLWFMVVVGLGIGWYRDRCTFDTAYRQLRVSSGMMNRAVHETVSASDYDSIQEKFHEYWRPYINDELGSKPAASNN
jgi:hypothetical protein